MAFALWQMSMKYKLSGSRDYEFAKKMYHQYAVEYWNTIEKKTFSKGNTNRSLEKQRAFGKAF